MKIYKMPSIRGGIAQFSFVKDDWSYYFITRHCGWLRVCRIGTPWGTTGVADLSVESNWLEVLVITGKSQQQIMKEIKEWVEGLLWEGL